MSGITTAIRRRLSQLVGQIVPVVPRGLKTGEVQVNESARAAPLAHTLRRLDQLSAPMTYFALWCASLLL